MHAFIFLLTLKIAFLVAVTMLSLMLMVEFFPEWAAAVARATHGTALGIAGELMSEFLVITAELAGKGLEIIHYYLAKIGIDIEAIKQAAENGKNVVNPNKANSGAGG